MTYGLEVIDSNGKATFRSQLDQGVLRLRASLSRDYVFNTAYGNVNDSITLSGSVQGSRVILLCWRQLTLQGYGSWEGQTERAYVDITDFVTIRGNVISWSVPLTRLKGGWAESTVVKRGSFVYRVFMT